MSVSVVRLWIHCMARDVPVVIDLFSGAGGMALGFRAAGCRILAGIDEDDAANATFQENFTQLQGDDPPSFRLQARGTCLNSTLTESPGGVTSTS